MNLLSISTIRLEKKNAIVDSANENNFGTNSEFTELNLKFQIICVELYRHGATGSRDWLRTNLLGVRIPLAVPNLWVRVVSTERNRGRGAGRRAYLLKKMQKTKWRRLRYGRLIEISQ